MTEPIFTLIPSGYKTSQVYAPIPASGVGDFLFGRSSYATKTNKDGLLESSGWYQPRLDYSDSKCPSLLLEPSATNLMPYSEDFTQGWNNFNITDTANAEVSPDGKLNATKIERQLVGASYSTESFNKASSSLTYTSSIFVKQGNTPYFAVRSQGTYPARVDLRFEFATKSFYYANAVTFTDLSYKVEELPYGWFRLSWTYTTDASTILTGVSMTPRTTDSNTDGNDIAYGYAYVWGAMCQLGKVATSYILTEGSSASTNTDALSGSGNAILWKDLNTEGSWYFNIKPINDGVEYKSITISDATNGSRILLRQDEDYIYRFYLLVDGVSKVTLTANLDQDLEWHKIAVRWKRNNVQMFLNGVEVATSTSVDLSGALDYEELSFDSGSGSGYWNGSVKEVMVWNEYLTDEELIEITQKINGK